MRSFFPALGLVLGLVAVGCASTQEREAIDPSSDPSWLPPGQGDLTVADSQEEAPKDRPKPRARQLQEPNHREQKKLTVAKAP